MSSFYLTINLVNLAILFMFILLGQLIFPALTFAQSHSLPKAEFKNYLRGNNSLPSAGGFHLNEGLDRKPGAPAGVYNPGEPSQGFKLVQWDKRRFPLKVWISQGKKLSEIPFSMHQEQRPDEVHMMLSSPASFDSLETCAGWTTEMNYVVANGFEQWREMENEGVVSFGFVDKPEQADILVFWVDKFDGSEEPGGNSAHALTCAKLFWTSQVKQVELERGYSAIPHYPVVMEFRPSTDPLKLQAEACHEFGHALGIKAHSDYRDDIMYVYRIVNVLSPADKATLRWLYKQKPDMLME